MRKQLSGELERLEQMEQALVEGVKKDPLFIAGQERLQEAWATKGERGLNALLELRREKGPWLDKICSRNWARLEKSAASLSSLIAIRECEALSRQLRDGINMRIEQLKSIPEKIKNLDPHREAAHLHGCKGSDDLDKQIVGKEVAKDLRSRIEQLDALLAKIKTKPGAEVIEMISPLRPEVPNGPARQNTAFDV